MKKRIDEWNSESLRLDPRGGAAGLEAKIAARKRIALALTATLALSGCIPELVTNALEPRDLAPASVTAWGSVESRELCVDFNEDITAAAADFAVVPDLGSLEIWTEGGRLRVKTERAADPGQTIALEGIVQDVAGNTTRFVLPFWGFNPRLPRVLINEARTQGSSTHPDIVELRALEAGNLAGLTFFVGSYAYPVIRYIFPSCEVTSGEFIVLHLRPQGIAEEVDEVEDPAASGGADAIAEARDFWYRDADGALPGENGSVTLYRSPSGLILDALLYSARTSDSDTKYLGFGTQALLNQALDIVAAGGWEVEGPSVRPEDTARSSGTTSTRTLCRSSNSVDTDSTADWHVVPTKGSTIGAANSDEVYVP